MADQSRGLYSIVGCKTVEEVQRKMNFILRGIVDRLDQIEGLRGTPTFHKSEFDFPSTVTVGSVLKAYSTGSASMETISVTEVADAAPTISSGISAQIDIERSLISLIDYNDEVVHQFPTQFLEYNSDVFAFSTFESFEYIVNQGDVYGPNLSVDSDIAEFDGITGKIIKDGGLTHASVAAANAHQVAQDAIDGIIEGDGAGGYSAVTSLSGDYLLNVYDDDSVIVHTYPLEWTGYTSDVFRFVANGVDLPDLSE